MRRKQSEYDKDNSELNMKLAKMESCEVQDINELKW